MSNLVTYCYTNEFEGYKKCVKVKWSVMNNTLATKKDFDVSAKEVAIFAKGQYESGHTFYCKQMRDKSGMLFKCTGGHISIVGRLMEQVIVDLSDIAK